MLANAKPVLEQELYKYIYDAYMEQFSTNPEAQKYATEANDTMIKAATKFASKLSKGMADAVYKFVMDIGITVTIPPTVIAPPGVQGGPCSGTILPTNFNIS